MRAEGWWEQSTGAGTAGTGRGVVMVCSGGSGLGEACG